MKISNLAIFLWVGGVVIFLLAPFYDSLGIMDARETAYLAWAMAFPVYFIFKKIEEVRP